MLHWVLVGLAVLVAILGLGLLLNRKKSTAHLAIRLAEAYRRAGDFETALELYRLAPELDQNVEPSREGQRRAREGIREPVIEAPLVDAAHQRLSQQRQQVVQHLEREGIEVELPPIEEPSSEG